MTNSLEKSIQTINELYEKYKDNAYMLQRIHNHINIFLPNNLENEYKNYEKRVERNNYLSNEQQLFIDIFLSKNKYYYLSNNSSFYEYNGKSYNVIKEDDILHNLLSNISKERVLLSWKYKTKINILKLIKERSLYSCIPETDTIQNVLNMLYPYIFTSKNFAKYFLTVIGDNILKKNSNLIFLVSPKIKKILSELDNIIYISIGQTNVTNNFITKYHENHSYDNSRLIKINEDCSIDIWKDVLNKIGLDLICVAIHYSKRYENSDKFIETKAEDEMKNYILYLKLNTSLEIIETFCNQFIVPVENNCSLSWKNIHFIWKQFISNYSFPNMIYSNTLKNMIKEKYEYNEELDCFNNVTSKYLPIMSDFIQFWEKTITIKLCDTISDFDSEFEMDEICSLFKIWTKQNSDICLSNGNIGEQTVLKILLHFFPNTEIIEDKYILNITCILWDKIKDIENSFVYIKSKLNAQENYSGLISFDIIYNLYCKFCNTNSTYKYIVSKKYFEKYIIFRLQDYIIYDSFINNEWLLV